MLIIIVPFRAAGEGAKEREEQKSQFIDHIEKHVPEAMILIAEQSRGRKFNRGKILNAATRFISESGYFEERDHRIIFHDVDLLPMQDLLYAYKNDRSPEVFHIAAVWKRYTSSSYLGGVLAMNLSTIRRVNGFGNRFEGWGGEDDELRDRIVHHGIRIERATHGTLVDLENMTIEEKLARLKKESAKCRNKWEVRDGYKRQRRRGRAVEGLAENACKTTTVSVSRKIIHVLITV